jgi:hypothetical protein
MPFVLTLRWALPLLLVVVASLLVGPPAADAQTSGDYEQVVDLTFPVAGPSSFIDDYHQCRSGCERRHRATDIMAPYGATVHAAVGGSVTFITGVGAPPPSYGYMLTVRGDDGRDYSYIHLGRQDGPPSEAYAPGIARGERVERGQLLGYSGCSGNASCSWPHLHFEIHDAGVRDPYGGSRINPYTSLVDAVRRGDLPTAAPPPPSPPPPSPTPPPTAAEVSTAIPVVGDWNGDGRSTAGWFEDGVWRLRFSHSEGEPDLVLQYGQPGDVPVVGDWNGDGRDTVGVVRNGNRWLLRRTYVRGDDVDMTYGRLGDVPVTGDWNGDGIDTIGVVRGNRFILRYLYRSGADIVMSYGQDGDRPVTGDFNGDGVDTIGVVRGNQFILRYTYTSGPDVELTYGRDTDWPVMGDWNGDGAATLGVVRDRRWLLRYVYRSGADYNYVFR